MSRLMRFTVFTASYVLTIPRHNPVKAFTMGGIVKDAGLTVEQFRALL
ncbi:type II toxin-antitoxin system HicA family toxin [Methyloglobulus morosus]|nr:hypothetical protein [Methyloglobulus morosus]